MAGPLAKATIIRVDTGEQVQVMFNPEEMRLDQGNTYAEVGIPGLPASPVQYVRGRARTLSMDLFFDTYEMSVPLFPGRRPDVRLFSGQVVRLLDQHPQTKAPPVLLFSLAQFQFQCVLTEANQRFTMFWSDGTPVRATVSVRFQEYTRVDFEIETGFFAGPPTVHTITSNDTLSSVAGDILGDPSLWRMLADANNIDDPLNVPVGLPLLIPAALLRAIPGRRGPGSR